MCDVVRACGYIENELVWVLAPQAGLQRCRRDFLRPCTSNAQCLAGDICLFDRPTFASLRAVFLQYHQVGLPDLSELVRGRLCPRNQSSPLLTAAPTPHPRPRFSCSSPHRRPRLCCMHAHTPDVPSPSPFR
jgi:hypothetical protein